MRLFEHSFPAKAQRRKKEVHNRELTLRLYLCALAPLREKLVWRVVSKVTDPLARPGDEAVIVMRPLEAFALIIANDRP